MTGAARIAALPMYDLVGLESAHDGLWSALQVHLAKSGISTAPERLSRHLTHEQVWVHPKLLLGQACEYPLAKGIATTVRIVATPRYRAPGCLGATYRSAIVVRREDAARGLSDLKGRRCVINERTSNSGMNLLRAACAPVAGTGPFFSSVDVSGSHRRSLECVVAGSADVAAIDCVTLAHLRRLDPTTTDAVRVLDWTPSSPSLPFITSASTSGRMLKQLRTALHALAADPAKAAVRDQLLLEGFDLEPAKGFARVLELERSAMAFGYSTLH